MSEQQSADDFFARLLAAETTEGLIPWEELRNAVRHREPIAPRERCEILLRAVNGEALPLELWSRLVGAPIQLGKTTGVSVDGDLNRLSLPLLSGQRQVLRAALERVIEDPRSALEAIGKNSADIVNGAVIVLPEQRVSKRKWIPYREHVLARSTGEALIYALNLFLDTEKPFGTDLRQCQWRACGRFGFREQPTTRGQPPNFYCGPEHREEHKLQQARERMAAKRSGISVERYRRRKK